MTNENNKSENQKTEYKRDEQPTTPAKPIELTDEQLEHVVGG